MSKHSSNESYLLSYLVRQNTLSMHLFNVCNFYSECVVHAILQNTHTQQITLSYLTSYTSSLYTAISIMINTLQLGMVTLIQIGCNKDISWFKDVKNTQGRCRKKLISSA